MNVYFAGLPKGDSFRRVIEGVGRRRNVGIMFSFFNFKPSDLPQLAFARAWGWKAFIDSGAFSAKRQGIPVSVGAYSDFLAEHGKLFDRRANLDVIGDAAASAKNYALLRKHGVLPVFHFGSPAKYLDAILEEGRDFALGGMVAASQKGILGWQAKTWTRIEVAGGRRVHGFGITGSRAIAAFPWDSVDSSTPTAIGKRGLIPRLGKAGLPGYTAPAQLVTSTLAAQLYGARGFRGAYPGKLYQPGFRVHTYIAVAIMILDFAARLDEHRAAQPKGATR